MEDSFQSKSKFRLPSKYDLRMAFSAFTKKEKGIFILFFLILLVSTVLMLNKINNYFIVRAPITGGVISEGILGTPRFANPILATSDVDRDITMLVYSGLMRKDSRGNFIPDLAERYDISNDGLTYTFIMKENILFHDETPITVDDVVFTINTIKDPILKSPRRGAWDGVTVEKLDDRTVAFHLRQTQANFLENTTLGILPTHIWEGSPIELNEANAHPIGSGPYKITKVNKHSSGIIDAYDFESFKKFSLGQPFINKIYLKFYQNEETLLGALENGAVSQISSVSPENANILQDNYEIHTSTLPRIFGLFFNQNQNQIFTDKSVLEAINVAIDKERIIRQVLQGYGVSIDSPIPETVLEISEDVEGRKLTREERLAEARSILENGGWKIGESNFLEKTKTEDKKQTTTLLEFVISTGSAADLAKAATLIQEDLGELGMKIEVRTFETGNLNQSVIRPRKYDALLFGQIVMSESDLYAFWHSSQRKDPGLNVAMYTNPKVDKILEETFTILDETKQEEKYVEFNNEIKKDLPAVFLYSPELIYVINDKVKNIDFNNITNPSERFTNIYTWYIKEDKIWKIFSSKE